MGIRNLFGTHSERELKRVYPLVNKIEALRDEMKAKSDDELRAKTVEFKERLKNGETVDDILVEAFAVAREGAFRAIGLEPYRVQLIGGIILHQGRISEMKTGEGKTLVATLPSYLNALEGKGVHVVTVNDYLARRDSEWMGKVHEFLGLTVGVVLNEMDNDERRDAYNCDITYITNNELGFDYLRDNMVVYKKDLVQRGLHYAIVDEVDSVLIDEARTPLIISGQSGKSTKLYEACDILARQLEKGEASGEFSKMNAILGEEIKETGDFIVNEKDKVVNLTADGVKKVEQFFSLENLADPENLEIQHNITLALRANYLMFKDQDYVVKDGEVLIVDEFTGRIMPGRRYSDGLHQAIEAKEKVEVNRESQTLATVTFQNFFNKYDKKSGMTGTALTEEKEFREIYGMDVIEIPTNRGVARIDHHDAVFKTQKEKFNMVIKEIEKSNAKGQPVLVGTITIETSELLSKMLKTKGIEHNVLNAKFHEQEAKIVAQAGHFGAVTIATNMAGRGTDILLGGNPEFLAKDKVFKSYSTEEVERILNPYQAETLTEEEAKLKETYEKEYAAFKEETDAYKQKVIEAGGLKIIGTERHESRRIDNQLRGRAGRQGDPGESKFFISLEDDLMRLFGSDRMMNIFNTLGIPENEEIHHKMLTKAIERAQEKIEGNNFGIRKNLLEYDQVMNEQRELIYRERRRVLDGENMRDSIIKMIDDTVDRGVSRALGADSSEWSVIDLDESLLHIMPVGPINEEFLKSKSIEEIKEELKERGHKAYEEKEKEFPEAEAIREAERVILLRVIDGKWMRHIDDMDQLRQGIGLQAYGQRDPLIEYKMNGYDMFDEMSDGIQEDTVRTLFSIKVEQKVEREEVAKPTGTNKDDTSVRTPKKRDSKKVYPNDPCPCGSGKKYKNCCGKN